MLLQQQEDFQVVATLQDILFRGLEMSLSSEDNVCLCRTNDDANVYLVNDVLDPLQVSAAVSLIANLVLQISFQLKRKCLINFHISLYLSTASNHMHPPIGSYGFNGNCIAMIIP